MLLNIKNLHVSVGGKEILKGLNLGVNEGEIHAIMGPNGTGKSTLAAAKVLFPVPLGPMMAWISPSLTPRFNPFRISLPPMETCKFLMFSNMIFSFSFVHLDLGSSYRIAYNTRVWPIVYILQV